MPAKIRLEIEGTVEEILEAFQTFVTSGSGGTIHVVAEPGHEDDSIGTCTYCGVALTIKQIARGTKYCSTKCSALASNEKRIATREANALKKRVEALTGRTCMECSKELVKAQQKFCSRKCSNIFHNKKRSRVVTTWKPSISVVAGQGVTRGSALTS